MAKQEVLIDVKLDADKCLDELEQLKQNTLYLEANSKKLREEFAKGTITLGDLTTGLINNKTQIADNERKIKGLANQIKLTTKEYVKYGDTLNDERAKLRDMQNAYAQLDASMRDSKGGKAFLERIHEQSEKVKGMEKAMGDCRRNVGNYQEALEKAGVGIGGFTNKMKVFLANPWAVLIGAIVTAFKYLVDAFKGSETRMRELNKATAPLKGALDMIRQVADKLAKKLSEGLVVVLGKLTDGMGWLAKQLDKLGKKVFKQDWGLAEKFESASAAVTALTNNQQKYEDHVRRWVVEEAKLDKQIAELKDKSVQKDKYSAEERIKFLEQVADLERKKAAEETRLAKEHLALLEADGARAENDADANNALAEAKAAVTRAETAEFQKMKEINAQIVAAKKEIEAETNKADTAAKKAAADEKKATEEQIKLDKSRLDLKLAQDMERLGKDKELTEEAHAIQEQYYTDLLALYEEDTVEYNNVLAAKAKYNAEFNEKVRKNAEETTKKAKEEYKKQTAAAAANFGTAASTAASSFNQIAGMYEEGSQQQKDWAVAGVIASEAATIASEGKAIAEGIAGATEAAAATGPAAPFVLAGYIAMVVATIMSGIVNAVSSIKQAKEIISGGSFSTGGIVGGSLYSGDQMSINANSREMVLTQGQQARLFEIANGSQSGYSYEMMAAAMATAVAAMPAPTLALKELADAQNRVTTYNEFASI